MNQYSFAPYEIQDVSKQRLMAKYGIAKQYWNVNYSQDIDQIFKLNADVKEFQNNLKNPEIQQLWRLVENPTQPCPQDWLRNLDRKVNLGKFRITDVTGQNIDNSVPDHQPKQQSINWAECCALVLIWTNQYRQTSNFRYLSNAFKCADLLKRDGKYESFHLEQKHQVWTHRVLAALVALTWNCFENT